MDKFKIKGRFDGDKKFTGNIAIYTPTRKEITEKLQESLNTKESLIKEIRTSASNEKDLDAIQIRAYKLFNTNKISMDEIREINRVIKEKTNELSMPKKKIDILSKEKMKEIGDTDYRFLNFKRLEEKIRSGNYDHIKISDELGELLKNDQIRKSNYDYLKERLSKNINKSINKEIKEEITPKTREFLRNESDNDRLERMKQYNEKFYKKTEDLEKKLEIEYDKIKDKDVNTITIEDLKNAKEISIEIYHRNKQYKDETEKLFGRAIYTFGSVSPKRDKINRKLMDLEQKVKEKRRFEKATNEMKELKSEGKEISLKELTKDQKLDYTHKEITKLVKEQLKQEFPNDKFSVTMDGNSIEIALMETNKKIIKNFKDIPADVIDKYTREQRYDAKAIEDFQNKKYHQLGNFYDEYDPESWSNGVFLTKEGYDLMRRAFLIAEQYNWDNSDPQSDYFDVHFYLNMRLGQYDKPLIEKEVKK